MASGTPSSGVNMPEQDPPEFLDGLIKVSTQPLEGVCTSWAGGHDYRRSGSRARCTAIQTGMANSAMAPTLSQVQSR